MKYIFKPSLQHMTLVKLAVKLWDQTHIRNLIASYNFAEDKMYFNKKWQQIEDKVLEKLAQLPLHEHLKNDLRCTIKPIGRHIKAWCANECHNHASILNLLDKLCWTPNGTIDQKRTAEMLVKDENVGVDLRYVLACVNCLEDEITKLWKRLTKQQKISFYMHSTGMNPETSYLVEYWTYPLIGELSELNDAIRNNTPFHLISNESECKDLIVKYMVIHKNLHLEPHPPHIYAFRLSVNGGNKVATEFFFGKLSDEERNTLLNEYASGTAQHPYLLMRRSYEFSSEVFHFLLSQMSEDQQMRVHLKIPLNVLQCFLEWPFKPFFMLSAERIVPLLLQKEYDCMVRSIVCKIVDGWTDCQQLLYEFQQLSSFVFKAPPMPLFSTLFALFKAGENQTLKLMFEQADAIEKEQLIVGYHGRLLCVNLANHDRWDSLQLFVDQCVPSKEAMVEFKNEFRRIIFWDDSVRWETFVRILDDLITKKS